LAKVKHITGLHRLDQIYLFLHDSPALQPFFDIVWDHKLNYRQKNIMETPTRDNTYQQSRDDDHYINFDHLPESFQPFHKLVFHLIHEQPTMVHVQRDNWDRWYRDGLRAVTDLEDIYNILQVALITAYIGIMYQYPIFGETVTINWTENRDGFYYGIKSPLSSPKHIDQKKGHNSFLNLPTLADWQAMPEEPTQAIMT
jgi:hypothetical protein